MQKSTGQIGSIYGQRKPDTLSTLCILFVKFWEDSQISQGFSFCFCVSSQIAKSSIFLKSTQKPPPSGNVLNFANSQQFKLFTTPTSAVLYKDTQTFDNGQMKLRFFTGPLTNGICVEGIDQELRWCSMGLCLRSKIQPKELKLKTQPKQSKFSTMSAPVRSSDH